MGYEVSTSVYAGPFDLLLHLILKQEVDLWEVSLSTIVDAYLDELDRLEALDLEVATEFLLIAATLVELKTRRLLPGPSDLELDEELLRFEERDLLLARLLECKTFKDAAAAIASRMRVAALSVARHAGPEEPYRSLVPDPLDRLKLTRLRDAALRALSTEPRETVEIGHIAPIRVTVGDAIRIVLDRLPEHRSMSFTELAADATSRLDVIVRFLALLELFKQGAVDLLQAVSFAELEVCRVDGAAPALDVRSIDEWDDADGASTASVDTSDPVRPETA
ncbi:MAG TPA: ScpA family protein [Acidimicrobiia bacterium]|nr:ScpA family protein [Acidimicrobiia bacterium]